jgi:hypothetical protein
MPILDRLVDRLQVCLQNARRAPDRITYPQVWQARESRRAGPPRRTRECFDQSGPDPFIRATGNKHICKMSIAGVLLSALGRVWATM